MKKPSLGKYGGNFGGKKGKTVKPKIGEKFRGGIRG
jgi:hypothetical protein